MTTAAPPGAVHLSAPTFSSRSLDDAPSDASCTVDDEVARGDLRWDLRTRADAVPSLRVGAAHVSAWLFGGARPTAACRIERSGVTVRGLVASSELDVVLARPHLVSGFIVPDGLYRRRVIAVENGWATLAIDLDSRMRTTVDVPCRDIGLKRRSWTELEGDSVYVDAGAEALVGFGLRMALRHLLDPTDSHRFEEPVRAVLLGTDTDASRRVVGFSTCGATFIASVGPADFRAPPEIGRGGTARCVEQGLHPSVDDATLTDLVTCAGSVPLFVRSVTFEDEVGVLAPGARLRIDGHERGSTTLVTLPDPPAVPIEPAHFSVRTSDLVGCSR